MVRILIKPNPISSSNYLHRKYKLTIMKNKKHQEIIDNLIEYLSKDDNENLRFTQALFILGINNFNNPSNPEKDNYLFEDNYNVPDSKILKTIKEKINNINESC